MRILELPECPACGHRHNFCFLGPVLIPGREYHYICPEIGKKATLRVKVSGTKTPADAVQIIVRYALLADTGPTGGFFDENGVVPW